MKRCLALALAILLLAGTALAAGDDALGLYMELTDEQQTALDDAAEEILSQILLDDMTDGEKALAIHDWIVTHCSYSLTLYRDMAYGALVEGTVICRGYARGFQYLAEKAGLSCQYTFSETLLHAWTLTQLDGSYYCIDPTWDDDHYERIGFVNHRHCMISTETSRERNHYGEDTDLIADGGAYESAPWQNAVTQVIFDGDYMYFIDRDRNLIRCSRADWSCQTLYTIEDAWPGFYEDYDGSPAPATGLVKIGSRLWFNTPYAIVSIKTNGRDAHTALTVDEQDGYICGVALRDGKLVWSVSDTIKNISYDLHEGVAHGRRLTETTEP